LPARCAWRPEFLSRWPVVPMSKQPAPVSALGSTSRPPTTPGLLLQMPTCLDRGVTVQYRRMSPSLLPTKAPVNGQGKVSSLVLPEHVDHSSFFSGRRFSAALSEVSGTGVEITYAPLAHFPRSTKRQRSLQKGKSGAPFLTGFLQEGQRSLTTRLRGMESLTRCWR